MTALFGHLDDEIGQKTTFITTLLMVVTTFLTGLLPTYAEIGLAAPSSCPPSEFYKAFH